MAAKGLEIMARTSSFTAITIVKQGGVASLDKLLRDGTDRQKEIATAAIASLGSEDSNVTEIVRQGGVDLIVGLLQVGADVQREEASLALQNMVRIGNTSRDEIVRKGVITSLVMLLKKGTSTQKKNAVCALSKLSETSKYCTEIHGEGGVEPLVVLERFGTKEQKQFVLSTLENLGKDPGIHTGIERQRDALPVPTPLQSSADLPKHIAEHSLKDLNAKQGAECCTLS
ncbi:hypothetical protein PI124_g8195 [Phytophthora idaei]|nr:hypothetical protein PI124_g8195 [Phytophthora idaei]